MNVKVLGSGCRKCAELAEKVQQVALQNNIEINLEKVTDLNDIIGYGVMLTPGLVVNDVVKSSGKLPTEEQILEWIK